MAVAALKNHLANPRTGIQRQRRMPEIHYFQDLMVGDARVHEAGSNMDSQPKPGKSAPPFKPAGDIIGNGDFFFRDPQNHLARPYGYGIAVFHMNRPGYILKLGIIFYVIGPRAFYESPEIVAERKIDRTRADLRFLERFDRDQFIF
jgi:hypothetical protein